MLHEVIYPLKVKRTVCFNCGYLVDFWKCGGGSFCCSICGKRMGSRFWI